MSMAAFEWEDGKLMLLMNRANWESDFKNVKPAAWDADGQILGAWFEDKDNNVGTWCGCSKNGRFSFFVETASTNFKTSSVSGSEIFAVEFLKSTLSPEQFANFVAKREEDLKPRDGKGLVYDLIVADITSKSMFHIGKDLPKDSNVEITEVGNGVHTLSTDDGLDSDACWDLRLKDLFTEMIGEFGSKQLPPIKEIPAKFMYNPEVLYGFNEDDFPGEMDDDTEMDYYGTTSTTVLVVKLSREIMFYERYLEDGEWKDHDFTFTVQ